VGGIPFWETLKNSFQREFFKVNPLTQIPFHGIISVERRKRMKLAHLRSDAPRERFPVFISNSGWAHMSAMAVVEELSSEWWLNLTYEPDPDGRKQGTFYLDARKLRDLEIEAVHFLVAEKLKRYPVVYDVANP